MEMKLFKINYLIMKMLKVNVLMVQAIAKYKISIVKSHQMKAGFGSRLSQIQDSYKYNSQNQGIGGNGIHKINMLTMIQILTKMQMVI